MIVAAQLRFHIFAYCILHNKGHSGTRCIILLVWTIVRKCIKWARYNFVVRGTKRCSTGIIRTNSALSGCGRCGCTYSLRGISPKNFVALLEAVTFFRLLLFVLKHLLHAIYTRRRCRSLLSSKLPLLSSLPRHNRQLNFYCGTGWKNWNE